LSSTSADSLLLGEPVQCPRCGGEYLHQHRVEVWDREEDASEGHHVQVFGGKVTVDGRMDRNPSPRRDGASVFFFCEKCTAEPRLDIFQHCGQTIVQWGVRTHKKYEKKAEPR